MHIFCNLKLCVGLQVMELETERSLAPENCPSVLEGDLDDIPNLHSAGAIRHRRQAAHLARKPSTPASYNDKPLLFLL